MCRHVIYNDIRTRVSCTTFLHECEIVQTRRWGAGWEGELVYFDGDEETVVEPEREIGFCSDACAWRYGIHHHRAMGMSGKDARKHLIEEHGLKPA